MVESGLSQKGHFGGFLHIFLKEPLSVFFFRLWRLGSWRRSWRGRKTRNASKRGVSEWFRVFLPLRLLFDDLERLDLADLFRILFCACYYFVIFEVRFFDHIVLWGQRSPWGCRTELVFKVACFTFSRASTNLRHRGRAGASHLGFELVLLPKMGCRGFLRLFRGFAFDAVFASMERTSWNSPLFVLGFFSFLRFLLGVGVNATLHVCFWAVGPQPFLFILYFV